VKRYYRESMSVTHDDYVKSGMHLASTAASSCAGINNTSGKENTGRSDRQPRRFRLFRQASAPFVGERPGRKLGPEGKSHVSLRVSVAPARNVI
jgi:hypothetical protein